MTQNEAIVRMKQQQGVRLARSFKEQLLQQGYPVGSVYLFGSVAKGMTHAHSDIDIVVVCEPFRVSRHDENVAFLVLSRGIDPARIETVCLHPADLKNRYSTIVQEVKRHGFPV